MSSRGFIEILRSGRKVRNHETLCDKRLVVQIPFHRLRHCDVKARATVRADPDGIPAILHRPININRRGQSAYFQTAVRSSPVLRGGHRIS